ncbi:hypothetical protein [Granulicoccus phenolivorans]|uniref:hypothetical protein n=1 Tax=Granulicoccus phenolivorans TaxID=266854 RepID=UPI00054D74C7|nr:hypothetical protein [Granulicoccus phenolivorans]
MRRSFSVLVGVVGAAALLLAGCSAAASEPAAPASPGSRVGSSAPSAQPNEGSALRRLGADDLSSNLTGGTRVNLNSGTADFVSPTGNIRCRINSSGALCEFPEGMDRAGVPSADHCGGQVAVNAVQIADGADPYVCSGGVLTDPSENGYGSWNQQIGFPWKDKDGQRWATLPYGNMIVAGDYACLSQEDGMYCINSAKGVGFKVAKEGLVRV